MAVSCVSMTRSGLADPRPLATTQSLLRLDPLAVHADAALLPRLRRPPRRYLQACTPDQPAPGRDPRRHTAIGVRTPDGRADRSEPGDRLERRVLVRVLPG